MPAVTPVTVPSVPIVATLVAELCHVPPVVASVNRVVVPAHNNVLPDIALAPFTVTTTVASVPHPIV